MKYLNSQFALLLCAFLGIGAPQLVAQCSNQVMHTTGSAIVGGSNVTITSVGNTCNWTTYCPAVTQPFFIGYAPGPGSGPGAFTFTFSPAINGIRLNFSGASSSGSSVEEVRLYINGAHYAMPAVGTASGCDALAILTGAGDLQGCGGCGVSGWSNTNITGFPITTLTVEDFVLGGSPNGSLFSLWICPAILPTEWSSFFASIEEDKSVALEWTTFSEINNDFFTVQRSPDGQVWDDLLEIDAVGTSDLPQSYAAKDLLVPTGIVHYRIRQTSLDGASSYSEISTVEIRANQALKISPNPVRNLLHLEMAGIENANVRILNALGMEVILPSTFGMNSLTLETSNLASGIYYAEVRLAGQMFAERFLVE